MIKNALQILKRIDVIQALYTAITIKNIIHTRILYPLIIRTSNSILQISIRYSYTEYLGRILALLWGNAVLPSQQRKYSSPDFKLMS